MGRPQFDTGRDNILSKPDYTKMSDETLLAKYESYRLKQKQMNLNQMAKKIALNSCYGSLGNRYSRYYDLRLATSITTMGQLSIRFIADRLNRRLNKVLETEGIDFVVYIDTDSVHLNLNDFVQKYQPEGTDTEKIKFLQDMGNTIQKIIDREFISLGEIVNNHSPAFTMECEAISDKALWTGKKRYVLNVVADVDKIYPAAKEKIMGLEIKRSSTPDVVKPMLEKSIRLILSDDISAFRDYINVCREEFFSLPPEEIAFPRGVSSISKYICTPSSVDLYKKGTPIAVRAAIMYNHLVATKKLSSKYSMMTDGSKIKFIYLKMPNPIHENVIGFNNALPEEFDAHDYIDTETQFSKTFIEPIESILQHIGWEIEETPTLF